MKKITSLLLAFIIILSTFSLSACSLFEKGEEYTKIYLTSDNYENYIAVNIYYSDCIAMISPFSNSQYYNIYDLSCIGHIVTSKKGDYHFEDVTIKFFQIKPTQTSHSFMTGGATVTASLDWDGNSHCSFAASDLNYDNLGLVFPYDASYSVTVSGYVIVPKSSLR